MSEYKSRAGTIYVEKSGDKPTDNYDVWFEDFCILGTGDSALEALNKAWSHTADILALVAQAHIDTVRATPAPSGE